VIIYIKQEFITVIL